jgi:hypothetical protein
MGQWDSAALQHLQAVVDELRAVDVAALFEEQVRTVWCRNVDAFDQLLGDTPLSLGIDCAENLRELVLRACAGEDSPWQERGVSAVSVDRSLRVDACGVRISVMKAPPFRLRTPDWTGAAFNWGQESDVRRSAAERNSAVYRPANSDQPDRQLVLPVETQPSAAASGMKDLLLVWSGQMEPALTAGWLGLPSIETPSWYAVEPLWWDEPGEDAARRGDEESPSDGDGFADRPTPQPHVRLKDRRDVAGDQQQP